MRMLLSFTVLLGAVVNVGALLNSYVPGKDGAGWNSKKFKNLIVFGDSYSDESRLAYFGSHNGTLPPPGTVLPESYATASAGRIWTRYVIQYTGKTTSNGTWKPQMTLYDYAVGGAVCSNDITPRIFTAVKKNFPDIIHDELGTFIADKQATNPATGEPTFSPAGLSSDNTLYVVWTGGNDLGADCFFTDSQVPGTSIIDYLNCVYNVVDELYAQGGRYFVLPNNPPFDLAPLYANASEGGIDAQAALNYWPTGKGSNLTEIAEKMREYILLTNDAAAHRIPYDAVIARRYPGAKLAHYDMHSLFLDIHQNPNTYLNGSRTPYNTSAYAAPVCKKINGTCSDPACCDSFMWYDSLHKSEQTDRILAREFVKVINGNSSFATYWHS